MDVIEELVNITEQDANDINDRAIAKFDVVNVNHQTVEDALVRSLADNEIKDFKLEVAGNTIIHLDNLYMNEKEEHNKTKEKNIILEESLIKLTTKHNEKSEFESVKNKLDEINDQRKLSIPKTEGEQKNRLTNYIKTGLAQTLQKHGVDTSQVKSITLTPGKDNKMNLKIIKDK